MGDIRNDDRFWDDLAPIVDGDEEAVERHADLLAASDDHRDARHEAERTAALVPAAGADYVPPEDLEARLFATLDARGGARGPEAGAEADRPTADTPEEHAVEQAGPTKTAPQPAPAGEADRSDGPKSTHVRAKAVAKAPFPLVPLLSLAAAAVAFLALVSGAIYAFVMMGGGDDDPVVAADHGGAFSATLAVVARAAEDGASGVQVRPAGADRFAAVGEGARVERGSTLRTDERTRARLDLSDGTVLIVNHDSEITFDAATARALELSHGELVADVAHLDGAPRATLVTPTGRVEVLGTKFVLTATEESASVRVTRGAVRIAGRAGGEAEVKAGQEGLMPKSGTVTVSPATNLAGDVAWSELGPVQEGEGEPIPGLGELRARRPGEREDRERPLHLAHHRVTVRVVGNVARTEIEETFRNDSSETLEGIYRFPLPPDARIASLSLDVDGQWEEGAFVEKDRAQRIWRGVIRNATPEQQRVDREEFIWVPGPWRDPALLEWQRGGRFELRIFPIPGNGERRIRLSYTQTIAPHGAEGRRYTYPLAHSSDESTRVGRFEVDVRIAGESSVQPHGYQMSAEREDHATRLRYLAENFLAKGDLVVDYTLPGGESELRWWTFKGEATVPPADNSREGNAEVVRMQRELHEDARGYVVFALRPELPARTAARARDYVLVVDSSQSMVGERYDRATDLAASIVGEMDRRDRFLVLACDATCQAMDQAPGAPSSRAAAQVRGFLGSIRPAGASHLALALREAVSALEGKRHPDRDVRVVYIGDGASSVGHRRPASLAGEVERLTDDPQVTFTTVGIGGDADTIALEAIARSGGGHYVPYVPGQRASLLALGVLETTWGASLESASVQLPAGVEDVAPAVLPTIRAGSEVLVVGRLAGGEVRGEVVLRGKVAGRDFEDRYPVTLDASTAAGNAFVPRLWATETIEKLELGGHGADRNRIVALSKGFGVMSPHTSLLVLESEAMFRAFGVDRNQPALQWTGEEDMEVGTSTGLADNQDPHGGIGLGGLGTTGAGYGAGAGSGGGRMASNRADGFAMDELAGATTERSRRERSPSRPAPTRRPASGPVAQAAPAPAQEPAEEEAASVVADDRLSRRPMDGRWMRRVWYREANVSPGGDARPAWLNDVAQAEALLRQNPDSRDRHRALVRALSRAGQLDRAAEVAEQWIERDRLDPEALTYLSDVLGRQGKRSEAVRLLSGIVDLRPDEVALQERLANAFDRAGMPERACTHRIALAEIQRDDAAAAGAALRCERALGRAHGAELLLLGLENDATRQRAEAAAARAASPSSVRGDVILDATWSGGSDVDLSLITPQGTRLSWMGGRVNVVGEDGTTVGREKLGLRNTGAGTYVIEVSRGEPGDGRTVDGVINVRMSMNGTLTQRRIPFRLSSGETHTQVALLDVQRRSQLVPQ